MFEKNFKRETMKKLFAILLLMLLPLQAGAVVLPQGSAVVVQAQKLIDADEVKIGDNVNFTVSQPVKAHGKVVLPIGTEVTGKIIHKKNNGILGIPGKLEISEFQIVTPDNKTILLSGNVCDEGNNRYWANAGWLFIITLPLIFVKGNDAKIQQSNYYILHVVEDVDL